MTIKGKTAADRIKIARGSGRPTAIEYIEYIFDDFFAYRATGSTEKTPA